MEITKELFHSCLSGELVGYFILRNNERIHSEHLSLVNYNTVQTPTVSNYTYLLSNLTQTFGFIHTAYNEYGQNQCSRDHDIVDFEVIGGTYFKTKITKIKTYWGENQERYSVVYFFYENKGVCRLNINEGDNFGIIYGLYVDEKERNQGIGKDLIKACEEELQNWNVKYIKIFVDKDAKNKDFLLEYYKNMNYELFESSYSDQYGLLKKIK
jgi:GNAT superfamily N-acetyltransferase